MAQATGSIGGFIIGTALGGPIGGFIGSMIGSFAGGAVDSMLFPPKRQIIKQEGPRLKQQQVTTSTEGNTIKRVWGRCRIGGEVIWATRFRENVVVTTTSSPRTGKSGRRQAPTTTETTTYEYYCNFAVALCEGPIAKIGRIWADGKLIDPTLYTIRAYYGTPEQAPDPKMEVVEGVGKTPAYRNVVYLMFDDMNLDKFGNRLPQITAEIIRPLSVIQQNAEWRTSAVTCATGGEFMMGNSNFINSVSGTSTTLNFTNARNISCIQASLDDLIAILPNAKKIDFRVNWYGNSLSCSDCSVRPKVDRTDRTVLPSDWMVSDFSRAGIAASATPSDFVTSDISGKKYHEATPSDQAFVEGLIYAKSRGFELTVTPVVEIDQPENSATPNPYGFPTTPAYPKRDLITCNPAIGLPGTVDITSTGRTQVNTFFGSATPAQFGTWTGFTIPFTGTSTEWRYRRMILHYAKLCAAAGGVSAFHVGSGLANLTKIRDASNAFPAVEQLIALVAEVRVILPNTLVSYSASLKEWNGHNPAEFSSTTGDPLAWTPTFFHHLDPLWAVCNYVGIEWLAPLTDWDARQYGLDFQERYLTTIYDPDYSFAGMNGGELFDYRYTSEIARIAQDRTPIIDYTFRIEDHIFRRKDITSWWTRKHNNRTTSSYGDTGWLQRSKQIRFTMVGCRAIDKGSNDPDGLSVFSTGIQDDAIQRVYIESVQKWIDDPIKNITQNGSSMINQDACFVHSWDVRPYPDFPSNGTAFVGNDRYDTGQSIVGRVGSPSLKTLVSSIMSPYDIETDVSELSGGNTVIQGYLIDTLTSLRDLLSPLEACFFFDSIESDGKIKFSLRVNRPQFEIKTERFISTEENPSGYMVTRLQSTDLPVSVKMQYIDPKKDYQSGSVDARRLTGLSENTEAINYPLVLDTFYAKIVADAFLQEAWTKKENIEFSLPPSMIVVDAGDVVNLSLGNGPTRFRVNRVTTGYERKIEAFSYDDSVYPSTR